MSRQGSVRELLDDDPRRIGRYDITAVLGSGGMGKVYLGRSPDGALAAVKLVHADLARNPEFRRRFAREVDSARKVSGPRFPHIAAVLDADSDAERPWLATEYVPASSLHAVVADEGPLETDRVRSMGVVLAETLAAVHSTGLVHRDVKPPNILLADDGPKLIDFGIARDSAYSTLTRTGVILGTPQAMAPEQLEGRPGDVGPAADVFALGGVLCFAATGAYPFGDGDPTALSYRIVHREPDLGRVPTRLRPLVARCLAKDPAERPTAADVATALLSLDTHVSEPGPRAESESESAPPGDQSGATTPPTPVAEDADEAEAAPVPPRRRRWPLAVGGGVAFAALLIGALAMEPADAGHTNAEGVTGGMPAVSPTRAPSTACATCVSPSPSATAGQSTPTPSTSPSPRPPTAVADSSPAATRPIPPVSQPSTTQAATSSPAARTAPPTSSTQAPNTVPSQFHGFWAGPMRMTGIGMDTQANVAIDLFAGGIGQNVGSFTLTTATNAPMCSGHYTLTSVAADGTTNMTATIDENPGGTCVAANVHISSCACTGHQLHWLADGQPWTKNEGDLTYQHA